MLLLSPDLGALRSGCGCQGAARNFTQTHLFLHLAHTLTRTVLFTPCYYHAHKISGLTSSPRLFPILIRHNSDAQCCSYVKDHDRHFAYILLKQISASYKARMHLLICWICESSSSQWARFLTELWHCGNYSSSSYTKHLQPHTVRTYPTN